ncbi:hypothetical protein Tco_0718545 [Tanacetum coccineum]
MLTMDIGDARGVILDAFLCLENRRNEDSKCSKLLVRKFTNVGVLQGADRSDFDAVKKVHLVDSLLGNLNIEVLGNMVGIVVSSVEEAIQNMHGTVIGKQTVRISWGKTPAARETGAAAPWTLLPGALPPNPHHSGLRPE